MRLAAGIYGHVHSRVGCAAARVYRRLQPAITSVHPCVHARVHARLRTFLGRLEGSMEGSPAPTALATALATAVATAILTATIRASRSRRVGAGGLGPQTAQWTPALALALSLSLAIVKAMSRSWVGGQGPHTHAPAGRRQRHHHVPHHMWRQLCLEQRVRYHHALRQLYLGQHGRWGAGPVQSVAAAAGRPTLTSWSDWRAHSAESSVLACRFSRLVSALMACRVQLLICRAR